MSASNASISTDQLDPVNSLTDSVNQLSFAQPIIKPVNESINQSVRPMVECGLSEQCKDVKCPMNHSKGMFLFNPGLNSVEHFLAHNANQRPHHHSVNCTGINKTKLSKFLDKQRAKEAQLIDNQSVDVNQSVEVPQSVNQAIDVNQSISQSFSYDSHRCDYCHCACHPFLLCGKFRQDKGLSKTCPEGKSFVRLIGQASYNDVIPFYTSAFIAFYCCDELLPQRAPSSYIPSTDQVLFVMIQEDREMTSDLFRSQRGETFLSTNFVGGKRDYWSETAVKCAMRELEEEIGGLFESADVSLLYVKRTIMYQWETDKMLTHIDRHASQVTFFVPLPVDIMNRLDIAMPQFSRIASPAEPNIRAIVMWPEWEISRQLEDIKTLRQRLYDSRQPSPADASQPSESVRITFPAQSPITEADVLAIFNTKFGPVHNVRVRERDAFINFARNGPAVYAAASAIKLGTVDINGVSCIIMPATNKTQNSGTPSRAKKGAAVREVINKRASSSNAEQILFSHGDLFPFAAEVMLDLQRYCKLQNKVAARS